MAITPRQQQKKKKKTLVSNEFMLYLVNFVKDLAD